VNILVSVIIDNYNYEGYISKAIESVLNQSYKNIEIIVVDDGSSDKSIDIIKSYQEKFPEKIKTCFKENGGQASAFNAGVKLSTGKLICFLDSDDEFENEKVSQVVNAYNDGYEYIFNNHTMISENKAIIPYETVKYPYNGHNLFLVYYISKYVGDITSTISISKKLADKIFPIKDENGWRIQADDVIVFTASILSQSFFINDKLTKYRIHGENGYYNKVIPSHKKFDRLKRIGAIKRDAVNQMGLDKAFFQNTFNLVQEFKTHSFYDYELLKLYTRVLFLEMNIPFFKKIITYYDTIKFYLKHRRV